MDINVKNTINMPSSSLERCPELWSKQITSVPTAAPQVPGARGRKPTPKLVVINLLIIFIGKKKAMLVHCLLYRVYNVYSS